MGYINQYINHAYNNITIHINHILTVYYQPMDPMGDVDPKKKPETLQLFLQGEAGGRSAHGIRGGNFQGAWTTGFGWSHLELKAQFVDDLPA